MWFGITAWIVAIILGAQSPGQFGTYCTLGFIVCLLSLTISSRAKQNQQRKRQTEALERQAAALEKMTASQHRQQIIDEYEREKRKNS